MRDARVSLATPPSPQPKRNVLYFGGRKPLDCDPRQSPSARFKRKLKKVQESEPRIGKGLEIVCEARSARCSPTWPRFQKLRLASEKREVRSIIVCRLDETTLGHDHWLISWLNIGAYGVNVSFVPGGLDAEAAFDEIIRQLTLRLDPPLSGQASPNANPAGSDGDLQLAVSPVIPHDDRVSAAAAVAEDHAVSIA